jgi:hypothetical protein
MTKEVAENNLSKWFWLFKHKMCDEYPEYHGTFDYVVLMPMKLACYTK